MKIKLIVLRAVFLFVFLTCSGSGAALRIIEAKGRLPNGRTGDSAMYDGRDSIYLMGAVGEQTIVKYSISSDTATQIGTTDIEAYYGSGVWIGENKIIYFSGYNPKGRSRYDIWRVHLNEPNRTESIGQLLTGYKFGASAWDGQDSIYIINGYGNLRRISKFSLSNHSVVDLAELPVGTSDRSAVWSNGAVYIFGGWPESFSRTADILKYDPVSNKVTTLKAKLPQAAEESCAVAVGPDEILVIGGGSDSDSNNATLTVTRFTPSAEKVSAVEVNGDSYPFYGHACAYVAKLDRVYIFGGYYDTLYQDRILYIDLSDDTTVMTSVAPNATRRRPG